MGAVTRVLKRKTGFTQVDNATGRDRRLSFRARGILLYVLGLPDGAPKDARALAEESPKEGRTAILSALAELKEFGYYHTRKRQAERGRWVQDVAWCEMPEMDPWSDLDPEVEVTEVADQDEQEPTEDQSTGVGQPDLGQAPGFDCPAPVEPAPARPTLREEEQLQEEQSAQSAPAPTLPLDLPGADSVAAARAPKATKATRMRKSIPDNADPNAVALAEHVCARHNALMELEGSDARSEVSATAVEACRLLMTVGATKDGVKMGPPSFERAVDFVNFVFDNATRDSNGFRWADQIETGTGLRDNYVRAAKWAKGKRDALQGHSGAGGQHPAAEWRPGDPSMVASGWKYDLLEDLETNQSTRDDLAAAGVDVDARIAELRAERQGVSA